MNYYQYGMSQGFCSWWFQPICKNMSQIGSSPPGMGENNKNIETTTHIENENYWAVVFYSSW